VARVASITNPGALAPTRADQV